MRRASCDSEQECGAVKPRFEAPHVAEHRSAVQRQSQEKERMEKYSEQCKMPLVRLSKLNEVLLKDRDGEDVLFFIAENAGGYRTIPAEKKGE